MDRPEQMERYELVWPGKADCILRAEDPAHCAFEACPEDSVCFESTENLFLEGDNLDALKFLLETRRGQIKLIYIDPPYNTGKDRLYRDAFGRKNGEDQAHANWLNLMYPRLKLARELLSDDGAILINIDEHEQANLAIICSELFGSKNDLGTIVWDKRNPKGDARGIAMQHEYILVYAKNLECLTQNHKLMRPKKNAQRILDQAAKFFKECSNLEQANKKVEMDNQYYNRYMDVLNQINHENAMAEEIRQYEQNYQLQVKQLDESIRQFNQNYDLKKQEFAESIRQFNEEIARLKKKDEVEAKQAAAELELKKKQVEQEQKRWEEEMKLQKEQLAAQKAAVSKSSSSSGSKKSSGSSGSSVKKPTAAAVEVASKLDSSAVGPYSAETLAHMASTGQLDTYLKNGTITFKPSANAAQNKAQAALDKYTVGSSVWNARTKGLRK